MLSGDAVEDGACLARNSLFTQVLKTYEIILIGKLARTPLFSCAHQERKFALSHKLIWFIQFGLCDKVPYQQHNYHHTYFYNNFYLIFIDFSVVNVMSCHFSFVQRRYLHFYTNILCVSLKNCKRTHDSRIIPSVGQSKNKTKKHRVLPKLHWLYAIINASAPFFISPTFRGL